MEQVPKVSVIMPSLNVQPYIRECMDSVVNQTLHEIEMICVDAGSTDGTLEILREYAARDLRITIIQSDRKSYGYQMNIGIAAAKGEYIGIVETDDYIAERMYDTLYRTACDNNLDIVKADFNRFQDIRGRRKFLYANIARPALYRKVIDTSGNPHLLDNKNMYSWAGIYRRSFIVGNGILHHESPGASYQDNGFWFQTFTQAHRVMFLRQPFYFLRRDNLNSSFHSKGKVYCMCDEYDYIHAFLEEHPALMERYASRCAQYRFINYEFTLNRIADEYKLDFLRRCQSDFKKIESDGEWDNSLFDRYQWSRIHAIMENPDYVYYLLYYSGPASRYIPNGAPESIITSWSYRIGRAITWLPRKIRGGIQCLRDNGLRYTIHRTWEHMTGKT